MNINTQSLSLRQRGSRRDDTILLTIEERGALDADQVRALLFRHMAYGQRKAQERLLTLHRREKLTRHRSAAGTYIYTLQGDDRRQLDHLVGVNWVRIWFELCGCRSWETLHSFEYERDYKVLRHDGFAAVKNGATGKYRFCFIEVDRGTNAFNKIQLYNKLYASEGYAGRWWLKLSDRFPPVLIATTSVARVKVIQKAIQEHNAAGLEFQVRLIDEIREEVMGKCLRPHSNGPTE